MQLIEVKVRYAKETEDGNRKKVTETYLVDAISFTEAEERIMEELKKINLDEFTVEVVKKSNYADQYLTGDGKFYKAKVHFTIIDDKSGKKKCKNEYYLVEAKSIMMAVNNAGAILNKCVYDGEMIAVSETNIVDIIMEKE